ncbi:hypothetical protein QTP86_027662 [Hemibagrus guttatus]|nr:hypothetical protein QTP86_027662 [Hemibagrus guttatus]
MNTDQDGPYVCTAPGCTQRFQREDHLIIHRHKHEMTLKFSSIKCDNTLSDQTPTPTRFLRNCEEVGLFSDLELNQASDEEETKQTFSGQGSSGQTQSERHGSQHQQQCALAQFHTNLLHTHTSSSHCSMVRHTSHSTTNTQPDLSCLHSQQRHPAACAMQAPSSACMNTQLPMDSSMTDLPGPTVSRTGPAAQSQPANGDQNPMGHMMEVMSSRAREDGASAVTRASFCLTSRIRSPASASHSRGQGPSASKPRAVSSQPCSPFAPCTPAPGPSASSSQTPDTSPDPCTGPASYRIYLQFLQTSRVQNLPRRQVGGKRKRTADEDPDERRRKFLERNRAAASRCRQKRKVWVMSLEKKAEELTHTNLQLQNEVTLLKSEVIQLKQLLLAHKDCPVTRETTGNTSWQPDRKSPSDTNHPTQQLSHRPAPQRHTHTSAHAHTPHPKGINDVKRQKQETSVQTDHQERWIRSPLTPGVAMSSSVSPPLFSLSSVTPGDSRPPAPREPITSSSSSARQDPLPVRPASSSVPFTCFQIFPLECGRVMASHERCEEPSTGARFRHPRLQLLHVTVALPLVSAQLQLEERGVR